ncbi:hypothetical protein OAE22_00295 [bacterium]|nr:hypothetical protein [bacterium]
MTNPPVRVSVQRMIGHQQAAGDKGCILRMFQINMSDGMSKNSLKILSTKYKELEIAEIIKNGYVLRR